MLGSRSGPLAVALAVVGGIAAAPWLGRLGVPPGLCWLVAAAGAAASAIAAWPVRRNPRPRAWRRAAVLAVGFALGAARGAHAPVVAPEGVIADDRTADRVTGVVRGPVFHGPGGDGAVLDAGGAAIWLWTDERLAPGERVTVTGRVRTPRGPLAPGVVDRADAARARGAELELTATTVERLGDAGRLADRAWRWADATQAHWARAIDEAGGDPIGSAALRGIVVGDRSAVPPAVDQRWRAVGIYHVLSVSGLHLAVVAGVAFGVLRRLVAASPWGGRTRPARWAAPPALGLAIAYALVTGAQLATVRALIVIALVLIAQVIDRPLRLIDALGVAALAILAWRPADLLDPSFQLSFAAAITLALRAGSPADSGSAHGLHGPRGTPGARGAIGWLVRGFQTSAWVSITTAPITAYHFHQVAAGGVIGNLVLTPVIELAALPLGLAGVVLGVAPAITLASWIVGLADRGAELLAVVTPVGHIAVDGATVMAVLVALALWIAAGEGRPRARAIAWLALCLVWTLGRTPPPDGALRVTFLDIGQGDAALIELPDGAVWLIDAGGHPGARDLARAAAPGRVIDRVLAAYGHRRIDLAILSHPHPDHYLGLAGIAAPIGELWSAAPAGDAQPDRQIDKQFDKQIDKQIDKQSDTPSPAPDRTRAALPGFAAIAAELAARGTRLAHPPLGPARTAAGVALEVWAPRYQAAPGAELRCAADPVRTVNDNSLVVILRYRGRAILFTGDIEAEGEDELIAAGIGPVDVVKVAHHGSRTSSTPAFVAATRPRLAVISCGHGNAFGLPVPGVIERWRTAGADVARTDRDGAITVTIDARGALAIERFAP
jgi:competence protein ComEC